MYEESLRMPFMIRYPGKIKPHTVNDGMILNVDHAAARLGSGVGVRHVRGRIEARGMFKSAKHEKASVERLGQDALGHRIDQEHGRTPVLHDLIVFARVVGDQHPLPGRGRGDP